MCVCVDQLVNGDDKKNEDIGFDNDDRNDCDDDYDGDGDDYDDDDDTADELELLLGFLASSLCLRSPSAVIGTHAASHERRNKRKKRKIAKKGKKIVKLE